MTKTIELAYKKAHEYFSDEKSEAMDHQVLKNFESDIRADALIGMEPHEHVAEEAADDHRLIRAAIQKHGAAS